MMPKLSSLSKRSRFSAGKLLLSASFSVSTIAFSGLMSLPSHALEFPDTGDRGAPSSTAGGGTRGGWCEEDWAWTETSLLALAPKNNVITFSGDQAFLRIHAASIFNQKTAEIFVQNAATKAVVYEAQLTIDTVEPGQFVEVVLPATTTSGAPLLEKGELYTWEFAVICNTGDRARDYYINGLLEPVEVATALSAQLETASLEEQAELYASAGIWQETLMIAEQLRVSDPTLLPELLRSVGLDSLTQPETSEAYETSEIYELKETSAQPVSKTDTESL